MTTPNVRYRPRGDTAANWTATNPVLGVREIGLETDSKKFKVGDGATAWAGLAYWISGSSAVTGTLAMLGMDGEDGQDGQSTPGLPGPAGSPGVNGATGPQGPIGFAMDGEDGEQGMAIPGTPGGAGTQGSPGAPGATGPQGPIGFAMDGEEGEPGMPIPGAAGAAGAAAGGSTPTVRASNIQSSSAASYTVTWPTGTIAGDVVIIFGGHAFAFNDPAGWTILDNQTGTNFGGGAWAKVMSAGDIVTGSATITTTGSFNGVLAAITLVGTTVKYVKTPANNARDVSGIASVILAAVNGLPGDLVLGFIGTRAGTACTFSGGLSSIQAINAANASGALGTQTLGTGQAGNGQTIGLFAAGGAWYKGSLAISGP